MKFWETPCVVPGNFAGDEYVGLGSVVDVAFVVVAVIAAAVAVAVLLMDVSGVVFVFPHKSGNFVVNLSVWIAVVDQYLLASTDLN